jgi:hypothetical protein
MTEQPAKYDLQPNQRETPNLKFCPFTSAAIPGELGKLTFLRPPCDPEHCALGIPQDNSCSLSHVKLR